jgi:hypothetical protein
MEIDREIVFNDGDSSAAVKNNRTGFAIDPNQNPSLKFAHE